MADKEPPREKTSAIEGDQRAELDVQASEAPQRQVKNKQTWYSEGLRFECTQCGACCSGEPGYVWVDEAEIAAMADELEMSVDGFEHKFVRNVGHDKSLVEYPDLPVPIIVLKCNSKSAPNCSLP